MAEETTTLDAQLDASPVTTVVMDSLVTLENSVLFTLMVSVLTMIMVSL